MRGVLWSLVSCCIGVLLLSGDLSAGKMDGRLDIYFIDVEGGAATLLVTPEGQCILVDSGYPDNNGRDRNRILDVVRNVAGLKQIDHAVVSHWHLDHYGNHAALAAEIPILNFWDRGIPDDLKEDPGFRDRIADYRAASQNASRTLRAGSEYLFSAVSPTLKATVATASRDVMANDGAPNPFASEHVPQADDPTDNAASISLLVEFGPFRFLNCGDLTWNMEAKLMTPNNPLGEIDLFMATHHGLGVSNNPVLVKAVDPVTAVICNGPKKGGDARTIETLRACASNQAIYQLHRNLALSAEQQTPAEFIANDGTTMDCQGEFIKASVAPDGESYTIQIGVDGEKKTFAVRQERR